MQGLLIKLFELMGVTAGDFKLSSIDGNLWRVYLPLGSISADTYEGELWGCLLYTSPSPRDRTRSRMPSSA